MNPGWPLTLGAFGFALACWVGCAAILIRSGRHKVAVVGLVVHRSRFRRPPQLDVTYRAPGQDETLQARLTAGFAMAQEGEAVTVYLHPQDPHDASLGPGGYGHVVAVLLAVSGLVAAAFALRVLTL